MAKRLGMTPRDPGRGRNGMGNVQRWVPPTCSGRRSACEPRELCTRHGCL